MVGLGLHAPPWSEKLDFFLFVNFASFKFTLFNNKVKFVNERSQRSRLNSENDFDTLDRGMFVHTVLFYMLVQLSLWRHHRMLKLKIRSNFRFLPLGSTQ